MKCRRRARLLSFLEQIYAARSWEGETVIDYPSSRATEPCVDPTPTHRPSVGLTRRFACLQSRHGHLVQACRRTRPTSRRCCHRRCYPHFNSELVLIRFGVRFAGFQLPRSTSTRPAPKPGRLSTPPPTLNTASGSPLSTRSRLLCHTYKRDSGAHPRCAAASRREGCLVGWTCRRRRLLGRRVAARHVYTLVHIHPKFRVENVANPINPFRTLGTTLHEPRGWFSPPPRHTSAREKRGP
ncbi:hypothetical protein EV363DRAFT_289835 [Boletus edulis]|nr:hypothetical protein EV363DRAFT_289835 [Boletus edulis]